MRIPTLGAVTLAAAAAVVAVPTTANAVAPVAVTDTIQQADAGRSKAFNVLTNDNLAAGNSGKSLTVTGKTNPAHGSATCQADGDCFYTAVAGYAGSDTFTYTVSDGTESSTGTVNLTVFAVDGVSNLVTDPDTGKADSRVTYPEVIDLETVVKDSAGNPIQGVSVGLFARPSGGEYAQIASGTTNASGKVTKRGVAPETQTAYQWRTVGGHNSAARTVSVTPLLTAEFAKKTLSVGDATVITGSSAPATAGDPVTLEKLSSTGTWVVAQEDTFDTTSTATAASTFGFTIPANASRSNTYRVTAPAASGRNEAFSQTAKVKAYQADVTAVVPGESGNQDEWVTVENTGKVAIQLKDWVLSGGSSSLTLPTRTLAAGEFVRIHTGSGTNTVRNLYLKHANVWNNTSGTAVLTDKNAFEIESFGYGTP